MRGGGRFSVGPLAYLLKNRVYVGDVVYRDEVHRGEHAPILDRDLFNAVQAKLAASAVERKVQLRASAAILAGRLFDDQGNRMSPTHANKLGVRYRYYVSQALLQNRKAESGSVARVPASEIEVLVLGGIRNHVAKRRTRSPYRVATSSSGISSASPSGPKPWTSSSCRARPSGRRSPAPMLLPTRYHPSASHCPGRLPVWSPPKALFMPHHRRDRQ
jgi:hypothetical protein